MKEQLISRKTAILAKEKGFNWLSEYYYILNNKSLLSAVKSSVLNSNDRIADSCCSAPTQSLLQKWLREVHDIHIEINHFIWNIDKPKEKEYTYHVNSKIRHNRDTYEESLECGLVEGLSLI